MNYLPIIIPSTVTVIGTVITAFIITRQITLQRRLSYITSMIKDEDIMHWYKIFLKDLRFIYVTLEVFPELDIEEESLEVAHKSEISSLKLEFLTTYIRHVLRGDDRLKSKYPELAKQTDKYYDPIKVFTIEYHLMIKDFTNSSLQGLTFHPARPWFIALFSPAKRRYIKLISLINNRSLTLSKKRISDIEFEVREFMVGKW